MKRWNLFVCLVPIVLCLLLTLLLFSLQTQAAAAQIFSDDFEDGNADGWLPQAGSWVVVADESQVYKQISTTLTARTRVDPAGLGWLNYSVQSRIKVLELGSGSTLYAMLMARYQDSQNYYFMTVRSNNKLEIKKQTAAGSGSALASAVYSFTLGTWYMAALQVSGVEAGKVVLLGSINGQRVLTATDVLTPHVAGPAGLGTFRVSAEFDDVVVADAVHTLQVTKSGRGYGTVRSEPAGIDCGAVCSADYVYGTPVTLTASPGYGATFVGWDGACTGNGPCAVTVDGATNVVAIFDSPYLFGDDFEEGAGQWSVVTGTWTVDLDGTNVYSQTSPSGMTHAVAGSAGWTDYIVQAKARVLGNKYASLIARYVDANNYYFMALRADNHKIEFKRMTATGSVGLGSKNLGINNWTWYTAAFEVNGTTLRAYLDGTPVFTTTDSGADPLLAGRIGLGTLDCAAEFDEVLVTSLVPEYSLSVARAGTGSGTIHSVPTGILCGATCTAGFERGTVVTLSATPDVGSTFAGWVGAGCSGTGDCVVTMDAAESVVGVFSAVTQPVLLVHKTGGGIGSVTSNPPGIDCGETCAAGFAPGTVVTLTATADMFSTFSGWSGAGCTGTEPCVVTMDTAKLVEATFSLVIYRLTVVKAGHGTGTVTSAPAGISCGITCTAQFNGIVTLTAIADAGSAFAGWSGGGCSGTAPCVVPMTAVQVITATFERYDLYLPLLHQYVPPASIAPAYVAPSGSDSNPGTLAQPFLTLAKALSVAKAGQTVYLRGGTFQCSTTITLSQSGGVVNRYKIWAYHDEVPILDFQAVPAGDFSRGFVITGNYWHLKGLEIKNAPDNGIKIEGSYNLIEQCVLHHNGDSGVQIGLGSLSTNPGGTLAAYNQVLNCDSYRNFDAATNGSNADGMACKLNAGVGNVFKGCRAWENADDGWDLYDTDYAVVIENCWTWHNGDASLFGNPSSWGGNGNGFKLGASGDRTAHVVQNCVAFDHTYGSGSTTKGFDQNHNLGGMILYNNTAWGNKTNYAFAEQSVGGPYITLKNNLGFSATSKNTDLSADTVQDHNSWNLTVTADEADMVSLDPELAKARQADGSLPANDFARLLAGSDLIDQGVDVGIPFQGTAPDLGAFECW